MSSKRIKTAAVIPPQTRAEMDQLASDIAREMNDRATLAAQKDQKILDVNANYASIFSEIDERLKGMVERAQAWSLANQAEFGKARSIKFTDAEVGFRLGQPQVKPLKGWTFAKVLAAVLNRSWRRFIRTKRELDKDAILAAAKRMGARLAAIGVEVVQEESFFVDPKGTTVEKRETAPGDSPAVASESTKGIRCKPQNHKI